MCIACRQREPRSVLIRLVAQQDKLVVDVEKNLPGRGAWLHRRRDCLNKMLKTRSYARLQATDTTAVTDWFDHGSTGAEEHEATKKAGREPMGAR
ncbi:YlxR family protein [Flaviflexus sp.]|uniref:YlxR family protein n=1 Tax=Flaviflexus sp. TaxID=1969482 RepID=UPI00352EC07B